jgi:hypothetical protein
MAAGARVSADGHSVLAEVFDLAESLDRVLLTHTAEDFHALHLKQPSHHGIWR